MTSSMACARPAPCPAAPSWPSGTAASRRYPDRRASTADRLHGTLRLFFCQSFFCPRFPWQRRNHRARPHPARPHRSRRRGTSRGRRPPQGLQNIERPEAVLRPAGDPRAARARPQTVSRRPLERIARNHAGRRRNLQPPVVAKHGVCGLRPALPRHRIPLSTGESMIGVNIDKPAAVAEETSPPAYIVDDVPAGRRHVSDLQRPVLFPADRRGGRLPRVSIPA